MKNYAADECDPDNLQLVNIAEIIEIAGTADKKLSAVFIDVIQKIGQYMLTFKRALVKN